MINFQLLKAKVICSKWYQWYLWKRFIMGKKLELLIQLTKIVLGIIGLVLLYNLYSILK